METMQTPRPRTWSTRLKVAGALMLVVGVPMLLFLGLSVLPLFVRGNQDLYDAIDAHDLNRVQALLRRGADANSTWRGLQILSPQEQDRRRRFDAPPLMRAIQLDEPAIAAVLITHGADVKGRDAAGMAALTLAAQRGQTSIVKLLLDNGAEPQTVWQDMQRLGSVNLRSDIRQLLHGVNAGR
jgi:ankyrin repeat protein